MHDVIPAKPIHPGEILADELAELKMNGADLARAIHVPANRIYQLLAGKRAMTADTALRLQKWLGPSAQFWLGLQASYELDVARGLISPELLDSISPVPRDEAA